jgi:hypothetical protein
MRFVMLFCCLIHLHVFAQHQPKILFIGNSYTGVNDLPGLVTQASNSAGDSIDVASQSPGGQTLQNHSILGSPSRMEIDKGIYDFVVLQEQSQIPSFTDIEVNAYYYPYVKSLDSAIKTANPCAKTVLYMTWGRKNGDAGNCAVWPPVCTYKGMDSLLRLRILNASDSIHCDVSPVSVAWRYVIDHYPHIELYDMDGSHPSPTGSYLAACVFYTTLFKKDPTNITFNFILNPALADTLRQVSKIAVYNELEKWHIGNSDVKAEFSYQIDYDSLSVAFTNTSKNASDFKWYFGDGDSSALENPVHKYAGFGTYQVSLIANQCGVQDTFHQDIIINETSIQPSTVHSFQPFPNPNNGWFFIPNQAGNIEAFDAKGGTIDINLKEENGHTEIYIPDYKGIVFIKIQSNHHIQYLKILVQ